MAKLRRLFNMRIKHVSLVDKAANNRQFLIVKRNEGGQENMEGLEKVLKQVEDAINDIASGVADLANKIDKKETVFTFEVDKAGAKFSRDTVRKLTSLRDALNGLLGDVKTDEEEDKAKVSKEDKEEMAKELAEKMYDELKPKDDKKGDE